MGRIEGKVLRRAIISPFPTCRALPLYFGNAKRNLLRNIWMLFRRIAPRNAANFCKTWMRKRSYQDRQLHRGMVKGGDYNEQRLLSQEDRANKILVVCIPCSLSSCIYSERKMYGLIWSAKKIAKRCNKQAQSFLVRLFAKTNICIDARAWGMKMLSSRLHSRGETLWERDEIRDRTVKEDERRESAILSLVMYTFAIPS